MDPIASRRFLIFSGVGIVAFLADVVVFQAVLLLSSASPYAARVVSFIISMTTAWWLNRTFTFRDAENRRPELQWIRFLAANVVGGGVNYLTFVVMMATLPLAAEFPVLALATSSLCAVTFNYTAYQRYVFRTEPGR